MAMRRRAKAPEADAPGMPQSAPELVIRVRRIPVARGVERIKRVVEFAPQSFAAWLVLGSGEQLLDNIGAAEGAYRQAVNLSPRDHDARYNLALTLLQRMKLAEAEQISRQLVQENPRDANAWIALGSALQGQARLPESIAALRRSVELGGHPTNHSKLLVALHYADDVDPITIHREHEAWNAQHAQPLAPSGGPTYRLPSSAQPLRIGLVATDFFGSPSGYFILRGIECLDKSRCRVVCYSDRLSEDDHTARFRAAAEIWRNTMSLTDEQLATQVRKDQIDVLIDVGGHVGRRLLTFARRPAALQVTWFAYVGTTGLATMDGLIADRFHVHPGEEHFYTEKVQIGRAHV